MYKLYLFLFMATVSVAQNNPVVAPHLSEPVELVKEVNNPDLVKIRNRVTDDLLNTTIDQTAINKLIQSQKPDGSWADINYLDVSRTGFQHSEHLANMLVLAQAFKQKDSPFKNKKNVKKAFSTALDFWLDHDFICDNWWWNEMGTPGRMIDILLVMDKDLTERQHLNCWPC